MQPAFRGKPEKGVRADRACPHKLLVETYHLWKASRAGGMSLDTSLRIFPFVYELFKSHILHSAMPSKVLELGIIKFLMATVFQSVAFKSYGSQEIIGEDAAGSEPLRSGSSDFCSPLSDGI